MEKRWKKDGKKMEKRWKKDGKKMEKDIKRWRKIDGERSLRDISKVGNILEKNYCSYKICVHQLLSIIVTIQTI